MWIARDKDNELFAFSNNSIIIKEQIYGRWSYDSLPYIEANHIQLKSNVFPNISWQDEKPTWKRFIKQEWVYENDDYSLEIFYEHFLCG